MRRFLIILISIFFLVSCFQDEFLLTAPDGSEYWVRCIAVTDSDMNIIISDLSIDNMYGAASDSSGSRIMRGESRCVEANGNGSFFLRPDDGGSVRFTPRDIGVEHSGEILVYQLHKRPFERNRDLCIDYTDEPLYYDWDGRKVFEDFYRINLREYRKYGIDDPERVAIYSIRLSTRGDFGNTRCDFDDLEGKIQGNPHAVKDLSHVNEINYYILSRVSQDTDGGWRTCLRTPHRISIGDNFQSESTELYEIPRSQDELILELEIPDKSNIVRDQMLELTESGSGASICCPVIGKTEEGHVLVYIGRNDAPSYFPLYWWSSEENNDVLYGAGGMAEIRPIEENDRSFMTYASGEYNQPIEIDLSSFYRPLEHRTECAVILDMPTGEAQRCTVRINTGNSNDTGMAKFMYGGITGNGSLPIFIENGKGELTIQNYGKSRPAAFQFDFISDNPGTIEAEFILH